MQKWLLQTGQAKRDVGADVDVLCCGAKSLDDEALVVDCCVRDLLGDVGDLVKSGNGLLQPKQEVLR